MAFQSIIPSQQPLVRMHQLLLGSVAPRPIAWVSTIDKQGRVNLAPFFFFFVFSTRPPLLIISPNRAGKDGSQKDTLLNIQETYEAVIHVVPYRLVEQMNLTSTPYARGVNEFKRAGLTMLPSEKVKPPRVKEAPVHFECKVREVIQLGGWGGSGNLILCEVLLMHIDEAVLGEDGLPDPYKLDLTARMGKNFYCRVIPEAIFELPKPMMKENIGWDGLPEFIKKSTVLSANDVARLALVERFPTEEELKAFYEQEGKAMLKAHASEEAIHQRAKELIRQNQLEKALCLLLLGHRQRA